MAQLTVSWVAGLLVPSSQTTLVSHYAGSANSTGAFTVTRVAGGTMAAGQCASEAIAQTVCEAEWRKYAVSPWGS